MICTKIIDKKNTVHQCTFDLQASIWLTDNIVLLSFHEFWESCAEEIDIYRNESILLYDMSPIHTT